MDIDSSRAGRDVARPRAGRRPPASRWARTRASAACCSPTTAGPSPRATTGAPARPHAEARRPRPGRARPPVVPPPWSPSSRATTPAAPGPCSEALVAAGVRRVVFAQGDPNPVAAGGAQRLREAGIEVVEGLGREEARALNRVWTFAVEHDRPFVTWKFATTLDGRSAAADGTSRWVSGLAAPARHPPAAGAVRRDAGRHQHGRRRRPAADRPRRQRPTTSRSSRSAW